MTLEEQLKAKILEKFKSIREFSAFIDMPYSTIDSVLKRGIKNAGVNTVLKIFEAFDIDIESVQTGVLQCRNKAKKIPANLSADEDRAWAIAAIDQLSDEDFEAVVPLLKRLENKNKDS